MTTDAATIKRSENLLYLIGIVLSVPPLISLVQRQFGVPVAGEIEQLVNGYRSLSDAIAHVVHAPLKAVALPTPPPLIALQILSSAGMGMMVSFVCG